MSQLPLFRREVLDAKDAKNLGSIYIARIPGFTAIAVASICAACIVFSYAVWGHITKKARVPGLLVPILGTVNISTPQMGVLGTALVSEGQFVHAKQALASIDVERSSTQGETSILVQQSLELRRNALESQLALERSQSEQRRRMLDERIRSMRSELVQLEIEIDAAERHEELAKTNATRFRSLASSGFISETQAQQKQEEFIDAGSHTRTVKRNLIELRQSIVEQEADRHAQTEILESKVSEIKGSLASLAQEETENAARRTVVIVAPQDGVVSAIAGHAGATILPGQTILTILPVADETPPHPSELRPGVAERRIELEAELYAPSRTAGFVAVNQRVWLQYAAFPYQKFGLAGGRVSKISRTPINAQDLPAGESQALLGANQTTEPLYRITVQLEHQDIQTYGASRQLIAGMAVEADIEQDRRAVWEWLLEPLLASARIHRT